MKNYKEGRDPVFKSSPSQFMTVIYSMEYDGELNGELNGELRAQLETQLNESQKKTLEYIRQHDGCQAKQVSADLDVPFSTIDKHIRVLLKVGLVVRRDGKRTGGYHAI